MITDTDRLNALKKCMTLVDIDYYEWDGSLQLKEYFQFDSTGRCCIDSAVEYLTKKYLKELNQAHST